MQRKSTESIPPSILKTDEGGAVEEERCRKVELSHSGFHRVTGPGKKCFHFTVESGHQKIHIHHSSTCGNGLGTPPDGKSISPDSNAEG